MSLSSGVDTLAVYRRGVTPMDSWWDLGEGSGHRGSDMEPWRLECPFCDERGNFALAHHVEKKKANSGKRLNFDLYECKNCKGFVQVLWSAQQFASAYHGLYDYKVMPWPLHGKPKPSENWPSGMTRFWVQAHDSLKNENLDAANLMARSALQFVVREKGAPHKANLRDQIDDLASKGILHALMKDWAHEVRLLANESAHPEAPTPAELEPQDVRDIVNFLDLFLFYLYDFPEHVRRYRDRKNAPTAP